MRVLALLLAAAAPVSAVEIQVRYAALERILASQVFTQDGRRYVKGDAKTKCSFAYLEHPQIQGKDGLLRIRARFTGRSALNMFGQCVGLGDAFTVVIGARPTYKDGNIGLTDVTAEGDGKTGFYVLNKYITSAHSYYVGTGTDNAAIAHVAVLLAEISWP